jgi:cytoskeletal protein CcmA (bactofilin family)
MWNRRKDEPTPAPSTAPQTSFSESAREGIPMSTQPTRTIEPLHESIRPGGPAVLGKSVMVKGQIIAGEDLTIDGETEGTVELQEHRLTVGPNGKVTASVKAREVVVVGTLHGNVETRDKIQIRKGATLVGDIRTARIEIEDGAYFKGNIDIIRTEPKSAPAPQPKPHGSVPIVTPTTAAAAGSGGSSSGVSEFKR